MTFKKVFADLKKAIVKADISSLGGTFAYQCCITGDGEGTFYIAFKDGALSVEPYDYKENTAVFKASAETYKKVLAGDMSAADAVASGDLVVENNVAGCADILTFLSGKTAVKKSAGRKPADKKTAAPKATRATRAPKADKKAAAPKADKKVAAPKADKKTAAPKAVKTAAGAAKTTAAVTKTAEVKPAVKEASKTPDKK